MSIYQTGDALPRPLYYQAEAFSRIVFDDDEEYDIDLGLTEPAVHITVAQGNLLIAYAAVSWTDLEHAGVQYRCYGLSTVLTFPAFRRRGYGGQMVQAAITLITQAADADIALLWTTPNNIDWYTRYGWRALPALTTLVGDPAAPEVDDEETAMMLFISEKGRAGEPAFEQGRVYVGEERW
ncbi:MAG: GNAT family N-acetyltransferase [Chloroflexaceae bacterium]|nr:GNAT family N-acetyltransferase [Chloroflexaceae bacterium]NJL33798.1 GNAT family N-acetyltransferase [Chloroflexaceae bacterium]NJO05903.1 GNAT family N-acetyltransferase [Chloroflexaceae bacterium]